MSLGQPHAIGVPPRGATVACHRPTRPTLLGNRLSHSQKCSRSTSSYELASPKEPPARLARAAPAPRIDRIDVGEVAARCSAATFAVIRAVVLLLPGRPTRTVRIFDGLELVLPARGDGGW